MYDADFPYDVQWTDIDATRSALVFTYDEDNFPGLPELVQALKSRGQHYVHVFDAGISSTQAPNSYPPFDDGLERGVFIRKYKSNDPIIGNVKLKFIFPTTENYSRLFYLSRLQQVMRHFLISATRKRTSGGQI